MFCLLIHWITLEAQLTVHIQWLFIEYLDIEQILENSNFIRSVVLEH